MGQAPINPEAELSPSAFPTRRDALRTLAASAVSTLGIGCASGQVTSTNAARAMPLSVGAVPRWRGADVSFLPMYESLNCTYFDGTAQADALSILASRGMNLLRLRLWHTPQGGWCNLEHTLAMAKRAHALGLQLLLDIHYSDTWADPGQQTPPAAWAGLPLATMAERVHEYTCGAVAALAAQGTPPASVQIGNEITDGLLWPVGRISASGWSNCRTLLNAGAAAVRDALPAARPAKVMLHIDRGGNNSQARWWYDNVSSGSNAVVFDMIGLSYYPWWHGTLQAFESNANDLASRYGKPVFLVETAYPWTLGWNDSQSNFVGLSSQLLPGYPATPAGQEAFLRRVREIMDGLPRRLGVGVCWWAPEFVAWPGIPTPWENLTLFDFQRRVLPGASALG